MGWRVGGAMVLAALLAGCADNQKFTGLNALVTATPVPASQAKVAADSSFRLGELKPGLSKAELEAIYPNRMVMGSSFGRNQYFYVEPPGVTTGTKVARDRLELFLTDGKLAAFDVVPSDGEVTGATEIGKLTITPDAAPVAAAATPPRTASAAPPPAGKFGVQIGARRSEAEARALIDEMRARFPVLLGQQWAAIRRVSLPQGEFYRVVIGPLASAQQALQLCDGLKAQGTQCFLRGT